MKVMNLKRQPRVCCCRIFRTGVAFEWFATGRGMSVDAQKESPSVAVESFARDLFEERLLLAFRKIPQKKRKRFVVWFEGFV